MAEPLELIVALGLLLVLTYQNARISSLEDQVKCLAGECDHDEEWTEDQL